MTIAFMTAAILLTAFSGVPALFLKRGRNMPQHVSTGIHVLGCISGLAAVVIGLAGAQTNGSTQWPLPGGVLQIRIDVLSAFFLAPVFLIAAAGAVYGEGYWTEKLHSQNGRKLRFFYGILTAGLAVVMIAGDAWSFLAGWEIVGVAAFFLITTEHENTEARRAGWIYLIAAHVGTLVLFAMFGLLRTAAGTWALSQAPIHDTALITPIWVLALIGFGIKAGVMPFHVWLPEAHAAAPSHISAILSGVVLKLGVYGLVRMISVLPSQVWLGQTLLAAGVTSGILGVAFALAQHDLKRLLAYHSIENIGIILMGIGAGVLANALGHPQWSALAFAGGLLHVWNHALFKSLLFYSAGSVVHATGTRSIDAMGGLIRWMRPTAMFFLIGAVAISGLPPLNGFISEWLIFLSSFRAALAPPGQSAVIWILLVAPALALIGALAVACFVKVFSVVFLGNPRSSATEKAHEAPLTMLAPMGMLAAACFAIGLWPTPLQPVLANTASLLLHGEARPAGPIAQSLSPLPLMFAVLTALLILFALFVSRIVRNRKPVPTWDCGYASPGSRMQYTASSFADSLIGLFRWALLPDEHRPVLKRFFPEEEPFTTHVPDPVLDRVLVPGLDRAGRLMAFGRWIQTGRIQAYILYVLLALVILLMWSLQ